MESYVAIIVALIMSVLPLISQGVAMLRTLQDMQTVKRKDETERKRIAAETEKLVGETWQAMYDECQETISQQRQEIAELKRQIAEKDKTILQLQEATRPRPGYKQQGRR